jgi:Sugar-binding cellulase-like
VQRREYLKAIALAGGRAAQGTSPNPYAISTQRRPLAIAMWDFSWILRHHRLGEFENWDAVLDQLADRGYNAIRIDAMPHLVAPDAEGRITQEYYFRKDSWKPALWGNDYSVRVRPREALLEFLPKCHRRGIHVGLATWFPGEVQRFTTEDGLFRAWEGTLKLLEQNGFLDRVLYVDVLNEYPFWHGFVWLKKGMEERADVKKFRESNPDVHVPDLDAIGKPGRFNPLQKHFLLSLARQRVRDLGCSNSFARRRSPKRAGGQNRRVAARRDRRRLQQ